MKNDSGRKKEAEKKPPRKPTSTRNRPGKQGSAEELSGRKREEPVKCGDVPSKQKNEKKGSSEKKRPTAVSKKKRQPSKRPRQKKESEVEKKAAAAAAAADDDNNVTVVMPVTSLYIAANMAEAEQERQEKVCLAVSEDVKDDGKPKVSRKKKVAADWVRNVLEKGVNALVEEFKAIPNTVASEKYKVWTENDDHNRYDNAYCLDVSRVKVPMEGGDYIHANYVGVMENKPKQFICAQAPLENTAERFWNMVVAEEVEIITMLCETVEKGTEKCFQYFPMEVGGKVIIGSVTITKSGHMEYEQARPALVIVSLLEVCMGEKNLLVNHLHWRSWPDHGVPSYYATPMRFLSRFRGTSKPVVVHCSAGIGRTGTLVLIALATETMLQESFPGVPALLAKIRDQRAGAVQNELQYLYVHRCLVEYLVGKAAVTNIEEALEKFYKEYDNYIQEVKQKRRKKNVEEPQQ